MSGVTSRTRQAKVVALIPARAGSKRVRDKNIAILNGHPLIAYTISAALKSNVFDAVIVSTDSKKYADIARYYGAEVPSLRPPNLAGDTSPDIEWIKHSLIELAQLGREFECFSILRPTSPCRKPQTIQRAWKQFCEHDDVDSLRAVELCAQHPGKMWVIRGARMHPLLPLAPEGETPYHSTQYAALPKVYTQNASLEIARTAVALKGNTIAGEVLTPFLTIGDEGLDINSPQDWRLLQMMISDGEARLPEIDIKPFAENSL